MADQPHRSRARWRPDTCACAVVYEWDQNAEGDPPLECVEVDLCEQHQALAGLSLADQFDAILEHNRAAATREE